MMNLKSFSFSAFILSTIIYFSPGNTLNEPKNSFTISIDSRGSPGQCQRIYFSSLTKSFSTLSLSNVLIKMQKYYASTPEYKKIMDMSLLNPFKEPFLAINQLKMCLDQSSYPFMAKAFQFLLADDILSIWCHLHTKTSRPPHMFAPFFSNPFTPSESAWLTIGSRPKLFSADYQRCLLMKISNNPLYNTLCQEHPVNPLDPFGSLSTFLPNFPSSTSPFTTFFTSPIASTNILLTNGPTIREARVPFVNPFVSSAFVHPLHNYHKVATSPMNSCMADFVNTGLNFAAMNSNPYVTASRTAMQEKFTKFLKKLETPKAKDTKFFSQLNQCILNMPDKSMGKKIFMLAADDILLLSCLYRNYGEKGIASLTA